MKTSILIFGSSGLVGSRFIDLYHKDTLTVIPRSEEVDITNAREVELFFEKNHDEFNSVINFAAYTDEAKAEKERGNEKGLVWQLNVEGPKNLAETCLKYGKYFIQVSSDFVFPGTNDYPGPYAEDEKTPDLPEGLGWYGWTKLMGERAAQSYENSAIVRISYPFRLTIRASLILPEIF